MGIRLRTLWWVPVFCLAAGYISYYITIYLGHFFFTVKTVGADGVLELSTHPVRTPVWHVALFVLFLLVGGLRCFRSMSKAEIALSAAIAIAVKLALSAWLQTDFVQGNISLALALVRLLQWFTDFSSLLYRTVQSSEVSSILSSFAPLLFIPFGKNTGRPVSAA